MVDHLASRGTTRQENSPLSMADTLHFERRIKYIFFVKWPLRTDCDAAYQNGSIPQNKSPLTHNVVERLLAKPDAK